MKIKISAVILTLNNERDIERCIRSLIDVCDEILVVDSYSTDSTEEICSKFSKVRFIQHKFDGFHSQSLWAYKNAKYDYIFGLDADEALSEELKTSVLNVKDDFTAESYYVLRLNQFCGKWVRHGRWFHEKKMRLFNRNNIKKLGVEPHGTLVNSSGDLGVQLDGELLHYSVPSLDENCQKDLFYAASFAKHSYKNKSRYSIIHIMVKSIWRFLKEYFIQGAIWDGYNGFVFSMQASYYTFLKYAFLNDEIRKSKI